MNDAVHYITALCVFGLLTVCLGLDRCKLVWSKVQTGRLHKTEHAGSAKPTCFNRFLLNLSRSRRRGVLSGPLDSHMFGLAYFACEDRETESGTKIESKAKQCSVQIHTRAYVNERQE
jgi:hypothetical protein